MYKKICIFRRKNWFAFQNKRFFLLPTQNETGQICRLFTLKRHISWALNLFFVRLTQTAKKFEKVFKLQDTVCQTSKWNTLDKKKNTKINTRKCWPEKETYVADTKRQSNLYPFTHFFVFVFLRIVDKNDQVRFTSIVRGFSSTISRCSLLIWWAS